MSEWCGNEAWGPLTDDNLDFTPCFRELVLETILPLTFLVISAAIIGVARYRARNSAQLQEFRQSHDEDRIPASNRDRDRGRETEPLLGNNLNCHGSASSVSSSTAIPSYASTSLSIDNHRSNGHSATIALDPLSACDLLLQPKDASDLDVRPEDQVVHPTTSDLATIILSMLQALGFLALIITRWNFLEQGGPHGSPGHQHMPLYRFVMPAAQCIVWLYAFSLCLSITFMRHIVRPSRLRRTLIVFVMFTFINASLRTRTGYRGLLFWSGNREETPEIHDMFTAELALAIFNLILSTLFTAVITMTPRGPPIYFEGRKVSSEINASAARWITFNWMNDLMWQGYEQALEIETLPSLTDQMRARPMYTIFANTRAYIQQTIQPSLLWRMYITNRRDIWINFVFGITSSITAFGVPFFLQKLLEYIEDRNGPKEVAYLYVFGMLISDITKSLTFGQNLYYGRRVDVRLKAMLSAEVYAKSLRRKDMAGIVSVSGQKSDTGKITNLMAVDANRVASLGSYIFYLYTCPLEIAIGIVMLYNVLGLSSLAGLAVMLLTSPLHHLASKKYAKVQAQLMETRDRRVGLMSELLQGIRMIKFFAWERNFQRKIMEVRDQELRRFIRLYVINTIFTLLWVGSPILVTIMSFASYTKLEHKELTPAVAFSSMAIYVVLRGPLNILPGMITDLLEAKVSIGRIECFLNEGEIWKYRAEAKQERIDTEAARASLLSSLRNERSPTLNGHSKSNISSNIDTIGFESATFLWHTTIESEGVTPTSTNDAPTAFGLHNITLSFPVGKLSLVCGSTGSGKTSLLMALLREMDLVSGKVHLPQPTSNIVDPATGYIPGTLAYVSQQPWLQQASIRDNILFGTPFETERYRQVLIACALVPDIEVFEDGDLTEIGEKGITLSGGQKQRVALARAMYSRAQHLLLDDCLSAVDAHTSRHLFDHCLISPLMAGRTRILVTHHVRLCLRESAFVALLRDGNLALSGSPLSLIQSGLLSEILEKDGVIEEDDRDASNSAAAFTDTGFKLRDAKPYPNNASKNDFQLAKDVKRLVDEEARSKGKVKLLVYNMYLKACGGPSFWVVTLVILSVVKMLSMLEVFWLKVWSSAYGPVMKAVSHSQPSASVTGASNMFGIFRWDTPDDDEEPLDVNYYIAIYCFITMMAIFLTIVRMFWQFYGSLQASRSLYERLLVAVARAPIRFFDTTPVGRMINRFSKDFEVIDAQMMSKMIGMLLNILGVISVVVIISVVTPGFLIAAVLIAIAYCFIGAYYIASSRELKRIESITKSPLYSQFGETLIGVSTIRAFGAEARFMEEILVKLDNNNASYYFLWMCNRWLSVRVDFMGALVSFTAGILILVNLEDLDASWAGLSLGSALNFMGLIYWLVRMYTEMEMSLNSVERVHEYLEMPQEPPAIIEGSRPPAGWPYDGTIDIQNLTMKYSPDSDAVLRNISIQIRPREKIGIVGRTGSGKSTLALSLFRFMEPTQGSISIDGIDISMIGLEDLRSRLTIIPQDAVLFNGTIRSNLDPFTEHRDHEIWEALRRVHLVKKRHNSQSMVRNDSLSSASTRSLHSDRTQLPDGPHHPHQLLSPEEAAAVVAAAQEEYEDDLHSDPFHPDACPAVVPANHKAAKQCKAARKQRGSVVKNGPAPHTLPGGACRAMDSSHTCLEDDDDDDELLHLNAFSSLETRVSDGGHNFSQGQRQLLCLARALLRKSKVIVCDEATASVDFAMDEKIQHTIRSELGESTLICIAHRLRTIMDYDRVLVMDNGKVLEFDSPINLITNPQSYFRDMIEKSGECDALFAMATKGY